MEKLAKYHGKTIENSCKNREKVMEKVMEKLWKNDGKTIEKSWKNNNNNNNNNLLIYIALFTYNDQKRITIHKRSN